jgi:hypothetical protein
MKSQTLTQSNQKSKIEQMERFYNWLTKIQSVHLNDNTSIMNACERVTESHNFFICVSKRIKFL